MLKSTTKVYLIGNVEHSVFKIGMAANVEKRRKALMTACPLPLQVLAEYPVGRREEAQQVEQYLHEVFAARKIQGEWFSAVTVAEFMERAAECTIVPGHRHLALCMEKERATRIESMVKAGGMCQSCFKNTERGHQYKGQFSDLWVCTDCREWLNSLKTNVK